MTFQSKLGIAFSSVLLLTIIVALTNYWGMGRAIEKQSRLYSLSSELELQFHQMIIEEKEYRTTKKLDHARAVSTQLESLKRQLQVLIVPTDSTSPQNKAIDNVVNALKNYEKSFAHLDKTTITMQTMKSRMLNESERLLANAEELVYLDRLPTLSVRREAAGISYLLSKVLIAQKDFILSEDDKYVLIINQDIARIMSMATDFAENQANGLDKLNSFRVAQFVSVYQGIFNQFAKEQKRFSDSVLLIQKTQDAFSNSLRNYLGLQFIITNRTIASLQLLSVVVSCLAVILGVVAVVVLSNLITNPINQLKKSARHIVDGNLDTSVTIQSDDDIGELGRLFNQMTLRLRESFRDIEEYRDHLEELVQERTEKLEQEIRERQVTEEALRASSERLSNIIDQSPMGIVIYDKDFTVLEWNPGCESIFGFSREEIVGKKVYELIVKEEFAQSKKTLTRLIATQESIQHRDIKTTKDGREIVCEWYSSPLTDSADRVVGALSLVKDVTEELQQEKELLKVKKLESTGVLAGGIAHDFNNMLVAILGNINLSLVDPTLGENTRKLLSAAEKASLRAQMLTQQLLTFAKGGEPVKEQTSLVEVIKDSADFVLRGSNASCHYNMPDDLWLVDADRGQISQVIQNIVLNCSQAMPGGGKIEISCSNVGQEQLREGLQLTDNEYVRITISDNGLGMTEQVLEKIFDPYYSTKSGGSGLGLAITLSIVRKHKGRISTESEAGKGTTFTIYLPAIAPKLTSEPGIEASRLSSSKYNILIMDDDEMVLHVLEGMLAHLGHQVWLARNGEECISVYQAQASTRGEQIDVVIMDLTIPGGKGGEETVQDLLQINPEVKAIVSSGYSNDPIMASYKKYGFCAAISKPYVMSELSAIIGDIVNPNSQQT